MKPQRSFTTTCLEKRCIAPAVYQLRFEKPAGLTYRPGQFVLFDVPLAGNTTDIQPRAYSIASTPAEQDLLFVVKLVPHGRASRWIECSLEAGTMVRMQGPFGAFTLDSTPEKPYIFVATGTGIAPLRSQIVWSLREKKDTRQMHLLIGVLTPKDLFWAQEWRALEQGYSNLNAHISCLSGDADWHGQTGTLQERLPRLLQATPSPSIYICGAPVTVKELKEQCLALGIPKADVHFESFV